MATLLDAAGNPTRPTISDADLLKILTGHKGQIGELNQRVEGLHRNMIQLGLYAEYLFLQLEENLKKLQPTLPDVVLGINHDGFPEWADKRFAEMQAEAKQKMTAMLAEQATDQINLNE